MENNKESYYVLDGNLYKIQNKNNNLICLMYIKKECFAVNCNSFDIILNGREVDKKELLNILFNK